MWSAPSREVDAIWSTCPVYCDHKADFDVRKVCIDRHNWQHQPQKHNIGLKNTITERSSLVINLTSVCRICVDCHNWQYLISLITWWGCIMNDQSIRETSKHANFQTSRPRCFQTSTLPDLYTSELPDFLISRRSASFKECSLTSQSQVTTGQCKVGRSPTCYGLHRSKSAQEKVKAKW